jgi:hypothetical protein
MTSRADTDSVAPVVLHTAPDVACTPSHVDALVGALLA